MRILQAKAGGGCVGGGGGGGGGSDGGSGGGSDVRYTSWLVPGPWGSEEGALPGAG